VGFLHGALIILIAPGLASCTAVASATLSPSAAASVSSASTVSSSVSSAIPVYSWFEAIPRRPGDEVRIDAVPVPSAPDESEYCGVAALESLTHYWGDPTHWRAIACEILSSEGDGATQSHIRVYLERRDYEANLKRSSLDAVRNEIQCGRPVLLFLKCEPAFARHVIDDFPVVGYPLFGWLPASRRILLVVGYDRNDEYFLCHSGNDTHSLWRHDELDRCWARTSREAILVLPKCGDGRALSSARRSGGAEKSGSAPEGDIFSTPR